MITFSQLVERTYSYLETNQKRGVADPPTREFIAEILQQASIDDVLQRAESLIEPRRLIIQEIYLKGRKWQLETTEDQPFEYRRQLLSGINGWKARSGTGKSTILKAIQWAITGVRPKLKPDIESWLKRVVIQVEIVGIDVYSIEYFLESGRPNVNVHGGIYKNNIEEVLEGRQDIQLINRFSSLRDMEIKINSFFSFHMGIASELEIFRQSYSQKGEAFIAWNIYAQSMFLADKYTDYLFPNSRITGKYHEETMGLHLGLDIAKAIIHLKEKVKDAEKNYNDERNKIRLAQADIVKKIQRFTGELLETEDKIHRLQAGESVRVNPDHAEIVRSNRAKAREYLRSLEELEDKLLDEQDKAYKHLERAKRTVKHLEESIEFQLFLSGINVTRCPHCENEISELRFEKELATGQCGLCKSELRELTDGSINQQNALLKQEKYHLKDLRKDYKRVGRSLKPIRQQIRDAEIELAKSEEAYRKIAQQELEGVTPELQKLVQNRGYLKGRLDELKEQTIEFQEQKVDELKNQRDVLKGALEQIQLILKRDNKTLLSDLTSLTLEYARMFGVPNLEAIDLDNEFSMTIKQGGEFESFRDTETSEALRIKIAFHLALLHLSFEDKQGRHPGLLIIDAPGSGEIDDHYLSEILTNLAAIETQFDGKVQILIASTKEEIIPLCENDPQRIEIREGDEPIF